MAGVDGQSVNRRRGNVALRLFQSHLQWTMQQMQRAMVISEAEQTLELHDPATTASSL